MKKLPSILVVDDEPDNFDVIEALLSEKDYELHYVANGQDAIATLDMFQPDLILLDVMMPGLDGIEVCRQIKALPEWHCVPIIMVTALRTKADLARCLETGADDFISKPVSAIELRARVHSMLRIKQQYDDLNALLSMREDMVNMVVHDLRNPLTTIVLGLEILGSPGYPQEKHNTKIAQIASSAQTLQALVDELLQIALIESGEIRLNCSDVDLAELVQSVVSNFKAIAAQKNQTLVSKVLSTSLPTVAIDRIMFHRALDNLVSNAIKFSPLHSQILITVDHLDSQGFTLQVIDAGAGVPEALRTTIFEKYEIGTRMQGISQIGLGLAFCKMVVEAHQGTICVKENQPKGAIFEITLPASLSTAVSSIPSND